MSSSNQPTAWLNNVGPFWYAHDPQSYVFSGITGHSSMGADSYNEYTNDSDDGGVVVNPQSGGSWPRCLEDDVRFFSAFEEDTQYGQQQMEEGRYEQVEEQDEDSISDTDEEISAPLPIPGPDDIVGPQAGIFTDEDLSQLIPNTASPMILASSNHGLFRFLGSWVQFGSSNSHTTHLPPPDLHELQAQCQMPIQEVTYADLSGDRCDFQGIDWTQMGTTRRAARLRRNNFFKNYVGLIGSDLFLDGIKRFQDVWITASENYFRFRRMLVRQDVTLTHFQLRNMLACSSRSQLFYATSSGINRLNPITKETTLALDLKSPAFTRFITTLDANCGVVVGGTFTGEYIVNPIYSDDSRRQSEGIITRAVTGITNHLQIHTTRMSSSPVVAICSNDDTFRTLDLETEQFIGSRSYNFALNSSALSPDRRLRVLVGDSPNVVIMNAETGHTEVELSGHRDFGFACDWSDDGVTVTTGFQDKRIKIWDARKWTDIRGNGTPVASIWCDMAGARKLKFSPLGGGEPVLVAAEEADMLNIINYKTLEKQTLDVFGEIAGVAFCDEGHELNVLVSDPQRGGLIQFDRCGSAWNKPNQYISDNMMLF